jgi:hypothetical protein
MTDSRFSATIFFYMTLNPRLLLILSVTAALVAGFLIGTFVLTIPSPKVTLLEKNEIGFSLHGTTRKGAAVIVFAEDGSILSVTRADAGGAFAFEALAPATGTADIFLRALDRGWRASPPRRVHLADAKSESSSATSTNGTELPPPGIPPTSTTPRAGTTSTAPEYVIEAISATASVTNPSPKVKTNQTVTVLVKDQTGALLPGATVRVIAHYPTENVTYEATGDGTYRARFRIPDNIGTGTVVLLDVTAMYKELISTTRTSFTVK